MSLRLNEVLNFKTREFFDDSVGGKCDKKLRCLGRSKLNMGNAC